MTSTAVEDALIEAAIDNIKTTREHGYVLPDAEVGGYLASPAVLTSNAEDKAVIYDTLTGGVAPISSFVRSSRSSAIFRICRIGAL